MAAASRRTTGAFVAAAVAAVGGAAVWLTRGGGGPAPRLDGTSDAAAAPASTAPATPVSPATPPSPGPPGGAAGAPSPAPPAAEPEGAVRGEEREARIRSLHPTWKEVADEGIPAPPPEFTASPLRWRLKFPMEPARFESLLRGLRFLTVDERTAVLQKVRRALDPAFGRILLEELPHLPDNPVTLFDFASALGETAEGARRMGEEEAVRRGLPPVRELTARSLALYARRVREFGHVMNEAEWGGIRSKFERLAKIDPGLFADDGSRASVDTVRDGVEACLFHILDSSRGGYLGGEGAFRLARTVADEGTHDLLARLLEEWDEVQRVFPHDPNTFSGSERIAFYLAYRTLLEPPCPSHAAAGAAALAARFRAEGAGDPKNPFRNQVSGLAYGREVPEEIRRLLCEALGQPFPEAEAGVPPVPPPPEPRPGKGLSSANYGESE